jgi:hypothetical protein
VSQSATIPLPPTLQSRLEDLRDAGHFNPHRTDPARLVMPALCGRADWPGADLDAVSGDQSYYTDLADQLVECLMADLVCVDADLVTMFAAGLVAIADDTARSHLIEGNNFSGFYDTPGHNRPTCSIYFDPPALAPLVGDYLSFSLVPFRDTYRIEIDGVRLVGEGEGEPSRLLVGRITPMGWLYEASRHTGTHDSVGSDTSIMWRPFHTAYAFTRWHQLLTQGRLPRSLPL